MSGPSRANQGRNIHFQARQFIQFARYADHILDLHRQHNFNPTDLSRRLEISRAQLTAGDLRLASVVAHGDEDDESVRRFGQVGREAWPIEWEQNVNNIIMSLSAWRSACRNAGYAVSSHEGQLERDEADVRRRLSHGLRLPSGPDEHIDLAASPSLRVFNMSPFVFACYVVPGLLIALLCAWQWYILMV